MRFVRVTSLLLFAAIITSFLSVPITTASYTIWLSSIDMPTTLNLFIASLIHDWFNLGVTLFLLFLVGLFFSLVSTSLIASDKLNTNDYLFFFKHLIFLSIGVFLFLFSHL